MNTAHVLTPSDTHMAVGEVGRLLAVGQREVEGVLKRFLSGVLVVNLTLDQVFLQEAVHGHACMFGTRASTRQPAEFRTAAGSPSVAALSSV